MSKKIGFISLLMVLVLLSCGTATAFAAGIVPEHFGIMQEKDDNIILGKEADKEADGIEKISVDMGQTWISKAEFAKLETPKTENEYWTYNEFKVYAKQIENDLTDMLAAGETDLEQEDIRAWQTEASRILEFIKSGGKVSKNANIEDEQLMISGLDNRFISTFTD